MNWQIRDRLDAAAFALGVMAFLHLSIGMRLFAGHNWWWVFFWAPNWRVAVFHQGVFALVGLLVYRLRLQGLWHNQSLLPPWVGTPLDKALEASAALTAAAVFLVLYLAVGVGLFGSNAWAVMTWPSWMGSVPRAVLLVLASFVAVSLFIYWLKKCYLLVDQLSAQEWTQAGEHEAELTACQTKLSTALANLENETRQAAQARMRAAEAEAKLRGQYSGESSDSGGDDKIRLAKKEFARLFHPDNIEAEGMEKTVRAQIYKEFWAVLESIEKRKMH